MGTGSTVNCFIDALAASGKRVEAAVSSSEATTARLRSHGIEVRELNNTGTLDVYIDGADEFDPHRRLIKGGGGALTREKIVAAASRKFVCIVDESKKVGVLGAFPLPVEVIPMARSYVARQLVALGGQPELRQAFVTDNGNVILDVHNLDLVDPVVRREAHQQPGGRRHLRPVRAAPCRSGPDGQRRGRRGIFVAHRRKYRRSLIRSAH